MDDKTAAVQAGSPEVIAAAADFFDNLNPAQQQKVRDFMERGRRWRGPTCWPQAACTSCRFGDPIPDGPPA